MITIWKYPLKFNDVPQLQIFSGPFLYVLSANKVGPDVCLWVEVDTDMDQESHRELNVAICGTGRPKPNWINDAWSFLDTVIDNSFVWHIYVKGVACRK